MEKNKVEEIEIGEILRKNWEESDKYVVTTETKQKITVDQLRKNATVIFWKLFEHAQRQYMAWLFVGISVALFSANYQIGWNVTESLPYHMFVVHKGESVKKGDIVAFAWDGGGKYAWMSPFKPGSTMVKYVLGVQGDYVWADGDEHYFVNGISHSQAKKFTKGGKPLTPLLQPNTGLKIDTNKYYVGTPHRDSMDSRYDMVGLIDGRKFIGKVYVIF
jgi:conjugal transfer pilin signal peptidase TrbI